MVCTKQEQCFKQLRPQWNPQIQTPLKFVSVDFLQSRQLSKASKVVNQWRLSYIILKQVENSQRQAIPNKLTMISVTKLIWTDLY